MNSRFLLPRCLSLLVLVCIVGCSPRLSERKEFAKHFEEEGYIGSLLVFDEANNRFWTHNRSRVDSAYLPASTFKIFNSLAALESGVAKDEKLVIPWDEQVRSVEAWNKDMDMALAFKYSCVPYYQEIARRIGREKMQKYLTREGFGNATIGPELHMFWLDASLRISQMEQVEFLRKLRHDELQFSKRNQSIVRNIMLDDSTSDYVIRAKTGWGYVEGRNYAWWVGWVEKGQKNCYFALNIISDNPGREFAAARKRIVRNALREMGWLENDDPK